MLSEHIISQIANVAYTAVRVWDVEHDQTDIPEWADLDDLTRDRVLGRVRSILSDPRAGDATFHNAWLADQKKKGWAEGKTFDESRKLDPNMVPFHRLSPELQARERLFRGVAITLSRV